MWEQYWVMHILKCDNKPIFPVTHLYVSSGGNTAEELQSNTLQGQRVTASELSMLSVGSQITCAVSYGSF